MARNRLLDPFLILTILVFMVLLLPKMFQEGMFSDGLVYSSIANNLSTGTGTFWHPEFSKTIMSDFHEHPPLAMGIQSFVFSIFGKEFYIEKIYSGITALLTAIVIVLIWRRININNRYRELFWLPVLFWITIPEVYFSYSNNMLENTMGLFSISAIYLLLNATGAVILKKIAYYILAGILLLLSFLTKGFPGLYPLGFFLCFHLCSGYSYRVRTMITDTVLFFVLFLGISATFLYFNTLAYDSLTRYIDTQVVTSLEGRGRVGPRLALLYDLFQQLVIIMIICTLIIASSYKRFMESWKLEKVSRRYLLLFLFIGASASIPLMISPKLSPYYLVPSLPFFAIALASLISSPVATFLDRLKTLPRVSWMISSAGILLIVLTIIYSAVNYGHTYRDKEMISDINRIGTILPAKSIIGVTESLSQEWSLMGYFQRKYQISIEPYGTHNKYLLAEKNSHAFDGYKEIEIRLARYKLFRKLTDN